MTLVLILSKIIFININIVLGLEKLVLICNNNMENFITSASFSHFVFPNLRKLKLISFPKVCIFLTEIFSIVDFHCTTKVVFSTFYWNIIFRLRREFSIYCVRILRP